MSQDNTSTQQQAATVQEAYTHCLNPVGGFLPATLPTQTLPAPFDLCAHLCRELPQHYHGVNAQVRPWLDDCTARWDPWWGNKLPDLRDPELHTLMTVLSTLSHAYRWNSAPPRGTEYQRSQLELPPALGELWSQVANRLGVPRVGSLYHLVLNNWRLRSRPEGGSYANADIAGDDLEMAYPYLLPPAEREARALFVAVIESEARGALALRTLVSLVAAVARRHSHETVYLLDRLRVEIQNVVRVFGSYIRKQHLTADTFLTLIQPTQVWGLDEGTGPLDGASGSQMPLLQALDAVLGLQRKSHTGQAILRGRRYLLPVHRRFLAVLDEAGGIVRTFVAEADDRQMTELFNECVRGVQLWRRMHQKRGAMYLKAETAGLAQDYISVGNTVTSPDDRVRVFEEAMQQRLHETATTLFPSDESPVTVEAAFHYLTPADRELLLAGCQPRTCAAGEAILVEGERRQGIYIIRSGVVRVVPGKPALDTAAQLPVAYLGEGELFGEMSFLENVGASSSVVAEGSCRIDVIEREHVYQLLASVPGFAGRFFQSLATLLSRRLRRTNTLLERLFAEWPPQQPPVRRTGRTGSESLPDAVCGQLQDFGSLLRAVQRSLAQGSLPVTEGESQVNAACETLLELATRYADAAGVLDAIYREAFPWLMLSVVADRLFHLPAGGFLDPPTLDDLRNGSPTGDSSLGPLVDRWWRTLPTISSLRKGPGWLTATVRRLLADWTGPDPVTVTGLGPGCARWLPGALATTGIRDLVVTCGDSGPAIAGVQLLRDDIRWLAWARIYPVRGQHIVLADCLFHHLSDRDAIAVLDWMHASIRVGGVALVVCPARGSPDAAFLDCVLNWRLRRRDPEELNDLFTESAFGADPVTIEQDETGATLYAFCTKR